MMTAASYYEPELGIDGCADDLARWAGQYPSDYSDEAMERIMEILTTEGRKEDSDRVRFELESRREISAGKRDLGRLKLWAMDGMYCLIDAEREGSIFLTVVHERGSVIINVVRDNGDEGTVQISEERFLQISADEFEEYVNACAFYAQPQ